LAVATAAASTLLTTAPAEARGLPARLECHAVDALTLSTSGAMQYSHSAARVMAAWRTFTVDLGTAIVHHSSALNRSYQYEVTHVGDGEEMLVPPILPNDDRVVAASRFLQIKQLPGSSAIIFFAYGGATTIVTGSCTPLSTATAAVKPPPIVVRTPAPPVVKPAPGGVPCFVFNGQTYCE
jgi:hypothetical protein